MNRPGFDPRRPDFEKTIPEDSSSYKLPFLFNPPGGDTKLAIKASRQSLRNRIVKVQSAVIAILSVFVAISLAGREDRLAQTDDLEKMLRDLEDAPGNGRKGPPIYSVDHAVTRASFKKENVTQTNSAGKPEMREEDVLDEIAEVIQKYRRQENENTEHHATGIYNSHTDAPSVQKTLPPSTTVINENPETVTDNQSGSIDRKDRQTLLKELIKLLDSYKKERIPTTHTVPTVPTTISKTTVTPTLIDSVRLESLTDEALDLAVRAVRLFLHMSQE
ncbi:uncharacterized protein LOC135471075 [Liolophura sinensis]|uniref:uncharacterized protein LOC135471075 n=1 Tax=Liolophura sinensis TaxID=3198878 RepID=UPI0031587F82